MIIRSQGLKQPFYGLFNDFAIKITAFQVLRLQVFSMTPRRLMLLQAFNVLP
jgi:hypothetical protein